MRGGQFSDDACAFATISNAVLNVEVGEVEWKENTRKSCWYVTYPYILIVGYLNRAAADEELSSFECSSQPSSSECTRNRGPESAAK